METFLSKCLASGQFTIGFGGVLANDSEIMQQLVVFSISH